MEQNRSERPRAPWRRRGRGPTARPFRREGDRDAPSKSRTADTTRGRNAAGAARSSPPPRIARVIDRDQVLHVARLARLRLTDEEVERMTGELSTILDHIEKISELDLDDVAPTSHVVAMENVLRPDEPRPSLPREGALGQAPDTDGVGFRVPSPGA